MTSSQTTIEEHTKAPAPYTPALLEFALFIHSGRRNFQRRSSDMVTECPCLTLTCVSSCCFGHGAGSEGSVCAAAWRKSWYDLVVGVARFELRCTGTEAQMLRKVPKMVRWMTLALNHVPLFHVI
jgi:hypothetical protein